MIRRRWQDQIQSALLAGAALVLLIASSASAQLIKSKAPITSQPTAATTHETSGATRVVLALGGVIGLILVMKWGARSVIGANAGRSSDVISILARCGVGPRQQLMLVHVGKRLVLVANGGAQMNALCEINEPEEVGEVLGKLRAQKQNSVGGAFAAAFKKESQKFELERAIPIQDKGEEPEIGLARDELKDLMDKVKVLTRGFEA